MSPQLVAFLTNASVVSGLLSAACWFRGSTVKVSHKKAMEIRAAQAKKRGEKPNFASVSLDGSDMSATAAAQSKWNAIGAFLTGCAVLMQSVAQMFASHTSPN